jgi:Rrf2 family iron-sulfur cluster assembly transcriptional regulator
MKISTRGRYALRMMIEIASSNREEWISIKDISERQGISIKYLEQIVTNLTRSGLLLSSRGPQGGYMLSKEPSQYTVGEILRVIEGELVPVACLESNANPCDRRGACPTIKFWEGLHDVINEYVDSFTLQDIIDSSRENYGYDFSI